MERTEMSFPQRHSLDGDDWQNYYLLPNEWRWRKVWEAEPPEAPARRIRSVVPGHVQQDVLDAGLLPHPYEGLNSRQWEWTSERDWVYTKEFVAPDELEGATVRLRFEGVDHTAHVFLNGEALGEHAGTLVPFEFDVTERLRWGQANRLLVVVERAPEGQAQIGWTSRVRHWKPRFAYGWDWCTRLVPLGIWDSVSLEVTGAAWLRDVAIHTNLSIDQKEAALSVVVGFGVQGEGDPQVAAPDTPSPVTVRTEVTRLGLPVGATEDPISLFGEETSLVQSVTVRRPELWRPNGMGDQPLYEARVTLLDEEGEPLDRRVIPFGIRRVELLPNEGAPEDALPYTFAVNGERLFARGWNWVPADQLYGRPMPERYERLLELARDAHVNLLRVWGGGLLERERFYDLCDRYGIMVWQEFPQSSSGLDNRPPTDEAYLALVQEQAPALVAQRRNHPSLVLWCGGNELTHDDFTPLTSEHPTLAAIEQVLDFEDPQRLWLPTSPSGPTFLPDPDAPERGHDVHGPWSFLGVPDHYRYYNAIAPLLHSEFGVEAPANLEALRWIAGERARDRGGDGATGRPERTMSQVPPSPPRPVAPSPLWPVERTNPLWMHHGGNWWFQGERVEALFGPAPDLETFVWAGQFLQAEGLRYAVEAHRRRQGRCSGTLPWQFNEAWPNATCTNAVDYFGEPKPAYDVVRRAYRPFHVSAAYETIAWHGRPEFVCDVWLHNEGEAKELLNVVVTVADVGGQVFVQENLAAEAPARTAESIGDVRWRLPSGYAGAFVLFLQVIDEEGQVLAENAYLHTAAPDPPFAPLLAAPRTRVELLPGVAHESGDPNAKRFGFTEAIAVRNAGEAFALGVRLSGPNDSRFNDNYLILPPGEERTIGMAGATVAAVRVTGWNLSSDE
jgi:beta-mannosidase